MKIWLDDIRPAPVGYVWLRSVNEAIKFIISCERKYAERYREDRAFDTSLLPRYWDIDHDAGDYVKNGGDYIQLLNWLEDTNRLNYSFKLHSANPVGIVNMRRIIERNGWTEIK